MNFKVRYQGFLQPIERDFPSREFAERWLRQVGKLRESEIIEVDECGCCGGDHPVGFAGDCRDDANRF